MPELRTSGVARLRGAYHSSIQGKCVAMKRSEHRSVGDSMLVLTLASYALRRFEEVLGDAIDCGRSPRAWVLLDASEIRAVIGDWSFQSVAKIANKEMSRALFEFVARRRRPHAYASHIVTRDTRSHEAALAIEFNVCNNFYTQRRERNPLRECLVILQLYCP